MRTLYRAWRFFKDHAGYSTPPGLAMCALQLARAERWAQELGHEFEWVWDDAGCSGCDCGSPRCPCSAGTDHETLGCVLRDEDGETLASLWGICGADTSYRRVVEAELADEAYRQHANELLYAG